MTKEVLNKIGVISTIGHIEAVRWSGVSGDSRVIEPGMLFIAVRGEKVDGHDYASDAVAKGAVAVVSERPLNLPVPVVVVRDSRFALAVLSALAEGEPTKSFILVGVTGTDGKTSTAMMIEAGLAGCGHITGLLGTVKYRFATIEEKASLTTPDPVMLQRLFARMRDAGVTAAVMEVSSHALDQHRVDACLFDVAVFTNLTRDHLDYHRTLEDYEAAKKRLFSEVLPASPKAKGAVLNADDPAYERIRAACPLPVVSWSLNGKADIWAKDTSFTLEGTSATIITPWGELRFETSLIGQHNLANAMAAIGTAGLLGLPIEKFAQGIASLSRIPGRLEAVKGRRGVLVFVDYAHTPKAIENVLRVLKSLTQGKSVTIVFGAGGDRDRGKRPAMGRAAALLADKVIVTSDNPRSEEPMAIIREIVAGIEDAKADGAAVAPFLIEPDRRKAIAKAIVEANDGDVVVVAGKGHEDYQIVGDKKLHFSDVEVAMEVLDS